ncbi:TolC family protein [Stakelama flava]|uniref:TolC family protein n=1 Tax=Stakelama flava TaxID=2860338 RepID=UPI0031BB1F2D
MSAAVSENLDVEIVRARVQQSRAAARLAGAELRPAVDAVAEVTTIRQSRETSIGHVTRALTVDPDYTQFTLGSRASWEIDLFGGNRRRVEAAIGDLQATLALEEAAKVSVAAETADAYLELRGLQARLSVAWLQVGRQEALLRLVRQRFDEAVVADSELNRTVAALEDGYEESIPR